ncbi:unnamed protein product [Urochloa decumbens]|uniref:Scarecrow-like protein 9 n=1 Tax=Urochloa decumbens TaxID=240449 RepID=A0ABC9G3P7_9POAL
MAATPEEYPEPFSPSVFLDLPPTPRPVGDGEENPAASSDDLVLPFILRMLMEDDIDDNQCPDHPALLQVQQPYAQILSDAAVTAAACSSDSAATNANGNGADTLSPSSGAAEFTNATWPYDPAQLSQLLLSTPSPNVGAGLGDDIAADDFSKLFLPQQEGTIVGFHQNRVTMDMLNLAFLRGIEEAKKFLPNDNNLLVSRVRKDEEVDGMPLLQGIGNGKGCKKRRNWDDLQAEMGRNNKLIVPEPEEAGEMVDEIIINDFRLCINEMQGLSITTGSEDEKNTWKGNGKPAQGKQSSHEAVDLRTLLIHCVQAVSMDDRHSASELLGRIKQHSSPRGDSNQRLAHCFAVGLEARLAGTGSQVYKSLMSKRTPLVEYLKAYQLYLTASCFKIMAYKFSNMIIAKVSAGRNKVHIVDYGMHHALQWSSLLGWLGTLEDGSPEVRFTGIDLPQPGFRPAALVEETGRRLSKCAHQFGVKFKFRSMFHFGNLTDDSSDIYSPSPRDVVLSNIQKMRPDIFILCVKNSSYRAPFFVTRFREALFYYSAMFDMLDATIPRDSDHRLLLERNFLGRSALNVIACEGLDRVERLETYKQWQLRNHRAGLRQLPLDPDIVKVIRKNVKDRYHKDFVIDVDHQWLLEGWKGRILCAMSTWVSDDAVSEH